MLAMFPATVTVTDTVTVTFSIAIAITLLRFYTTYYCMSILVYCCTIALLHYYCYCLSFTIMITITIAIAISITISMILLLVYYYFNYSYCKKRPEVNTKRFFPNKCSNHTSPNKSSRGLPGICKSFLQSRRQSELVRDAHRHGNKHN